MAENKSIFETLNSIDTSAKVKAKNNLDYLPWAAAWGELLKVYPTATYEISEQVGTDGSTRPWFTDGKSGWVKVTVTIDGLSRTMNLAIMDFKNQAIPAEKITSTDANKSTMRCLVKCIAMFGLGLNLYMGEDLPDGVKESNELKNAVAELVKKKCATEKGKEAVAALCKDAERKAHPDWAEEEIRGDYNTISDDTILAELKRKLMAIRIK